MAFPIKELTQEEYDNLPLLEKVNGTDREKMEIGFKFKFPVSKCSKCGHELEVERIVCEVVEPLDAISDQASGFGMHGKFINRYYAKIVSSKPA